MNSGVRWIVQMVVLLGAASAAQALTIVGYDPATNDRFTSGYSSAPILNTSSSFIGSGYDFSGVGWNPADNVQSFAMISDQYFVYATHNGHGTDISFLSPTLYAVNPATAVVTLAVDMSYSFTPTLNGQAGDLSIGRLLAPLSSSLGIASYPVLDLGAFSNYAGLPLFVYGRGDGPRIGTNTLDSVDPQDVFPVNVGDGTNDTYEFSYDFDAGPPGESVLDFGDSGGPTFAPWYGQLAILGTHSGVDSPTPTISYDTFIPYYFDQMTTAGIPFVTVPEPGRVTMLGCGVGLALMRRRRVRSCVNA